MKNLELVIYVLENGFPGHDWAVSMSDKYLFVANSTSMVTLYVSDIIEIQEDDSYINICTRNVSLNFHRSGILFIRVDAAC